MIKADGFPPAFSIPECAVCKKPVDRFTCHRDEYNMSSVYRAYCHGEVEQVTITDCQISQSNSLSIEEAFTQSLQIEE